MKSTAFSLVIALFLLGASSISRGQLTRESNSTLKFPAVLSSAPGQLEAVELMLGVQFDKSVCVASPPGETRLFVVERYGRVWVINDLANPVKQLFMDITNQ